MQIAYGYAGWIRVDDIGMPGPLYLRLRPDERGRWSATEVYLDGRDSPLTGEMLRTLPLAAIETVAQSGGDDQLLARQDEYPGILLSEAASHFSTTFGSTTNDWAADMWRSQIAGSGVPKVKRASDRRDADYVRRSAEVPALSRPDGPLTEEFLHRVATAYTALVAQGERAPAPRLAEQAGASVHAVRKWIYTARQRGIMPPGRRGRAG